MTSARMEAALWLLLLGGLLTGIGYVTDWGQRWIWPLAQKETSPAPFDSPRLTTPFTLLPPDAFIEIALRPLLIPTRRPAPPLPDTPRQTMKKGQFILTGTTIVGEVKFAHLIEKTGAKARVVAEGKEINGLIVKRVDPTRVTLTQNDETEIVVLQPVKSPVGTSSNMQNPPPSAPPTVAAPVAPAPQAVPQP